MEKDRKKGRRDGKERWERRRGRESRRKENLVQRRVQFSYYLQTHSYSFEMRRRQGHNILGIQKGKRGHYTSNKRRDAIKRATAARLRKGMASQPPTPPTPPSIVHPFNVFRIMNLDEFANFVQQITEHSATCGNSCKIEGKTYRAGLACIIQARCSKCDGTFSISSHFVDGDR